MLFSNQTEIQHTILHLLMDSICKMAVEAACFLMSFLLGLLYWFYILILCDGIKYNICLHNGKVVFLKALHMYLYVAMYSLYFLHVGKEQRCEYKNL